MGIVATAPAAGATVTIGTTSGGHVTPSGHPGGQRQHPTTDFPDPSVVYSGIGNTYYAYSTGTTNVVAAELDQRGHRGDDARLHHHWLHRPDAAARWPGRISARRRASTPASASQAPSVAYLGGQWVMYYGGVYAPAGTRAYAIYDATSSSPTSGFIDTPGTELPLMAQTATGGSTDPSVFVSPTGQPWLTWKSATYPRAPRGPTSGRCA